LQVWQSSNICK